MALMNDGDISFNLTLDDRDFKVSVSNAGRLLSEMRGNLESTAKSTKKLHEHFGSFTTQLRHTVMTMASIRFMLIDINDVFLTLPRSILRSAGEIERLNMLMQGLSKESTKAAREIEAASNTKFVFNMAKEAPFEVKTLTDAFVKFKSAGLDPTDGSMKALVDSVARFGGSSEQLHRASIAIQQMAGKGVISMEELRQQLGEAVPSAMQMMATGVGMSMSDLVKNISKGTVESKSALTRMFAVMTAENEGAAAAMMTTWPGMIEQLKTTWELAKIDMSKGGLFDTAKEELRTLIDSFDSTQMRSFMSDISFVTAEAAQGFANLANWVRTYYEEIKLAGQIFLAAFAAGKIVTMTKAVVEPAVMAYRTGIAGMTKALDERNQQEMVSHANAVQRSKDRIAAMEAERAAAQATYAQMNGDYNAMVAKRNALDREQAKFKSQAYAALLAAQIAQLEAEMLATKNNAIAHAGRAQALEAEIVAQRANLVALQASTVAQKEMTLAASAFAGMRGVLGGIWTAMGGWIGAVTMALTAGIMAWADYAAAAERAATRAKNAVAGFSTAKDLIAAESDLKKAQGNVAAWEDEKRSGMTAHGSEWSAEDEKALANEKERVKNLSREVKLIRENITNDRIEHAVRLSEREAKRETAGFTDAWRQAREIKLKAIDEDRKAIEEKFAGNEKEKAAALAKFEKEAAKRKSTIERDTELARFESLRLFYEQQNAKLNAEMSGASDARKQEIEAEVASNRKALEEIQGKTGNAALIGTPHTSMISKESLNKSPLDEMLASERARVEKARVHIQNIGNEISGVNAVRAEVDAMINEVLKSGRLKHSVDGKIIDDGKNKKKVEELREAMTDRIVLERASPIVDSIQKKQEELQAALENSNDAFDSGAKTGANTKSLDKWIAGLESAKNSPVFEKLQELMKKTGKTYREMMDDIAKSGAMIDLNNFLQPLADKTKEINASLVDDERKKKEELYRIEKEHNERQFKLLKEAAEKRGATQEELKAKEEQFTAYMAALQKKRERDMEHPMDRLAREWGQTTRLMEQATVSWADKTLDLFMQISTTGKADFRSFVTSVLTDIARIQMKESFGGLITAGVKGFSQMATNLITGNLGGAKGGAKGEGEKAGEQTSFFGSMVEKAGAGLKSLWTSITGATEASDQQTESIWGKVAAMVQEVFGITTKVTAEQAATGSLASLAGAAQAAATALASIGGGGAAGAAGGIGGMVGAVGSAGWSDWFTGLFDNGAVPEVGTEAFSDYFVSLFADGGIMSSNGPLPLRKYRNGGIADSPQFALFGEGDMSEAYVPLPDGRSIPVTMSVSGMQGGGANVAISIVVNNNGDATAESSSSKGDDNAGLKNMANAIKNIVVEQMVVQQRPGGVLYRG